MNKVTIMRSERGQVVQKTAESLSDAHHVIRFLGMNNGLVPRAFAKSID
jgi:hypothetical protein